MLKLDNFPDLTMKKGIHDAKSAHFGLSTALQSRALEIEIN